MRLLTSCRRSHPAFCLVAALLVAVAMPWTVDAQAALYEETASGDASGDRLAPTFLQLDTADPGAAPGTFRNVIAGTVGATAGVPDRDYFWFNVPAGQQLVGLRVGNETTVGGGGGFIGLATGSVMPVLPSTPNAQGLLGWKLYTLLDRNQDILPAMGVAGNGATGFQPPLGAGDYTLWIQELATGSFTYRFNLVIAPVPEPSALVTLASGAVVLLACFGSRRRVRAPA